MVFNPDDFVQWKALDITKAFFASVDEKREDTKDLLITTAGEDSVRDAVLRGYAAALQDILNTSLGDVSEDSSEED